uniref:Putative secreted protein n=1 Tax=Rhipicephalus microplus TaxID=6941 RepID=A0A6G5A534_RHIMP
MANVSWAYIGLIVSVLIRGPVSCLKVRRGTSTTTREPISYAMTWPCRTVGMTCFGNWQCCEQFTCKHYRCTPETSP